MSTQAQDACSQGQLAEHGRIATAECLLSLERKEFGTHATVHLIMALSTSSGGLHCMLFMSTTYLEASGIGGPPILLLFCKTDLSWNFLQANHIIRNHNRSQHELVLFLSNLVAGKWALFEGGASHEVIAEVIAH